jgi:hypothetical protein
VVRKGAGKGPTPHLLFSLVIQYDAIWAGYRNKIIFVDGDLNFKEFSPQDYKTFKSSIVISYVTGAFASIASSEQHSFLALSSLDGILKLINSYIIKVKGKVGTGQPRGGPYTDHLSIVAQTAENLIQTHLQRTGKCIPLCGWTETSGNQGDDVDRFMGRLKKVS